MKIIQTSIPTVNSPERDATYVSDAVDYIRGSLQRAIKSDAFQRGGTYQLYAVAVRLDYDKSHSFPDYQLMRAPVWPDEVCTLLAEDFRSHKCSLKWHIMGNSVVFHSVKSQQTIADLNHPSCG